MPLKNDRKFASLDDYLDTTKLLDLKDDFYYLYSTNQAHAFSTWTSGSITSDLDWPYILAHPTLYSCYHKNKDNPKVNQLFNTDKNALATYLQLRYGSFNPYRILKLKDNNYNYKDIVTPFNQIISFVDQLPFEQIDCVDLFYSDHYTPLGFHRDYNYFPYEDGDHRELPKQNQLIWFRFDLAREFFIYEFDSNGNVSNETAVEGYSAIFDDRDWHGNINSYNAASLTLKVEGVFNSEFADKYV